MKIRRFMFYGLFHALIDICPTLMHSIGGFMKDSVSIRSIRSRAFTWKTWEISSEEKNYKITPIRHILKYYPKFANMTKFDSKHTISV